MLTAPVRLGQGLPVLLQREEQLVAKVVHLHVALSPRVVHLRDLKTCRVKLSKA